MLQLLLEGATRGEVRGSQRCCALREIDVPSAGIAALGRGGAALRGAPSNSSPSLSSPSRSLVRRKEGSTGAGTISSRPPFLPARTGFSRVKRPPWAPRRCADAYSSMEDDIVIQGGHLTSADLGDPDAQNFFSPGRLGDAFKTILCSSQSFHLRSFRGR